ncbi:ATP-binding SpoIIE family protein phosphatase [Streptomyces flavofungini]|uniref:SpoIIE family protein phosphatase n=1 Tax=Streptomyces flavofungini TaxID=68200 RepID=A0ABS0WY27_9ACTN|nr:SpoIIE family protein phosphatase [Streptomyces flavofungini]MBJ3805820.1 SpoIIE family protein phosphatase [Streptomyces flavofungini]GHC75511.1 magnesium or manganese-dependent protein phosphatase [Streptomyces flavofungini]
MRTDEPREQVGDASLPPDRDSLPPVSAVLSIVATGLWRWDNATGTVTLDAEAARLLGLPPHAQTTTEAGVRSRFHPVDWNEIHGIVQLAVAEGTLAEARLRIMDEQGRRVLRTVRSRTKPIVHAGASTYELLGTIQEVSEPSPGSAARTPVTGDWRRSREAFLLDAGRALAEARSTKEVLRVAAGLSMPGFSPDGLAVFGAKADRLTLVGHHGHHGYGHDDPLASMPLDTDYPAAEVLRTGRAVYLSSPEDYRRRYPTAWPLASRFERQSWAFLPLIVAGRTMGAWMAAFTYPVSFTPDERSVLTTVARMLAQALSRAGVAESERELTEGLQRSMLPMLGPEIPGMAVAARYVPTGGGLQVGGDWYDVIPLPSGRIAFVIGDVQGHDVRAAGLMGQLRIALRAYASEGHRPDAVLSRATRFLSGITDGIAYGSTDTRDDHGGAAADPRFATCLYVEADPATGVLEIARAGHPEPVIRMSDGTVLQRPIAGGLPLGIDPDADYPTTRLVLDTGETMLICTDGLIETGGHDLETGWTRIRKILERYEDDEDGTADTDGTAGTADTAGATGTDGTADAGAAGGGQAGGPEGHAGFGAYEAPPTGDDSLEVLADTLVQAVHGPSSHHSTGPLADRREDDIAVLLLRRTGRPDQRAHTRRTMLTIAQAEPERVAGARVHLRDLLHDWSDDEQVDSAVLLVSEMITNVLVHTDGDALLVAEVTGEMDTRRLRVEVADGSDDLPHKRHPGELASSGRGLVLMELLADRWGVDPRGEGKSIWFELYEGSGESPGEGGAPAAGAFGADPEAAL